MQIANGEWGGGMREFQHGFTCRLGVFFVVFFASKCELRRTNGELGFEDLKTAKIPAKQGFPTRPQLASPQGITPKGHLVPCSLGQVYIGGGREGKERRTRKRWSAHEPP